MELRHRMIMDGMPDYLRLPSAYEKIPYITTNGNQALRTMYEPVLGDEFHVRFNGSSGTILSAGAGTYQLVLIGGFSNTGWYCKCFSSATCNVQPNYVVDVWYDLDIDASGTVTTNNQTFLCPPEAELDGTATTLWIAERRNATQQYTGSIAEFWIKNNGKYKMYLIPCRRKSDQKVGMYDTISKTFYVSARSDFIAGT